MIELYRNQIYQETLNEGISFMNIVGEVIKFSNASFCEIRKNKNQIDQEILYQLSNQDRKNQYLKSSAINSQEKEIYILKLNVLQRLNESHQLINQIDINSEDINQIIYFNNSLLVVGLKFLLIYDSQLINYTKLQYPSDLKSVISTQEQVALITVNNDLLILRGLEFQILSSIYAYDMFQGQNYILQKQGAQFHLFIWNSTDGQKQLIQNLFIDYEPQQLLVFNDLQFLIITSKTLIIFNQTQEIQIQNRQYQAFKFKNHVILYSRVGALNVENFICLPQQVIQLYEYDDQLFALNMDYLFKFSINEQIRRLYCNPTYQNFGQYQLSLTGGQERVIQIDLKRPVLTSTNDLAIILFAVLFLGTIFFFGILFKISKKSKKVHRIIRMIILYYTKIEYIKGKQHHKLGV
ncbi:hypothetical protein pb186bvf_008097 [Paramecium bursaria]